MAEANYETQVPHDATESLHVNHDDELVVSGHMW